MSQTQASRGRPKSKYGKFIASYTVLNLDCLDETLSSAQHKYFESKRKEHLKVQQQVNKFKSDPSVKVKIFDRRLQPEELALHLKEFEASVQASFYASQQANLQTKEKAKRLVTGKLIMPLAKRFKVVSFIRKLSSSPIFKSD